MRKIGLLSDTHGFIDDRIVKYFSTCDEIWHAGDIGDLKVTDRLSDVTLLRAVHGNIDGIELKKKFPYKLQFNCENVQVCMTHIGGYPGRYAAGITEMLFMSNPDLFIAGHSHILKVMNDKKMNLLYMNPGAAGRHGMHKVRTLLRFEIDDDRIENLEVIELGTRV